MVEHHLDAALAHLEDEVVDLRIGDFAADGERQRLGHAQFLGDALHVAQVQPTHF